MCLQCGRPGFDPWVGKIPWRRKWQSTPVLLPGKSHGERSLVGYSPWGRKELDTTERLHSVIYDPMDCSLPGSSLHGIFQAIVLEWIAISFSRGSSQPRDRTRVSRIVDRRFTVSATREYLSFSFRLTSLCIIGSRFIHLIRTDSNAFLFMAE